MSGNWCLFDVGCHFFVQTLLMWLVKIYVKKWWGSFWTHVSTFRYLWFQFQFFEELDFICAETNYRSVVNWFLILELCEIKHNWKDILVKSLWVWLDGIWIMLTRKVFCSTFQEWCSWKCLVNLWKVKIATN